MNNIQKFLRRCSLVCSLLMAALTGYAQESLQSPDGKYTFAFAQKKGQLTYTLSYSDKTIVEQGELGVNIDNHLVESAMGIPVDTNRMWTKGMKVINVSRRSEDNTWKPTYGEYAQIRDHYNEMTIHLMKGGISSIKFGFVQIGSQEWTTWLHRAVRKCDDHHIMVDIHDEYRPTGWSRTYPNLMTQEGIGGNEDDLPNVYKGETPRSIHAPMCCLPS